MTSPRNMPNNAGNGGISLAEFSRYYDLKKEGLERVLGSMYHLVGHAIIPFQVGGTVDMYYFPYAIRGTAFATMELVKPDGSGPLPSRIGTYELVAFTRHSITDETAIEPYKAIERRMCGILTSVGHYAHEAALNPGETCEVPGRPGEPYRCLVLDEWKPSGIEFRIGDQKHGLLLCLEVFRSEMEFAMKWGSRALLDRLQMLQYDPYSDLDRAAIA